MHNVNVEVFTSANPGVPPVAFAIRTPWSVDYPFLTVNYKILNNAQRYVEVFTSAVNTGVPESRIAFAIRTPWSVDTHLFTVASRDKELRGGRVIRGWTHQPRLYSRFELILLGRIVPLWAFEWTIRKPI